MAQGLVAYLQLTLDTGLLTDPDVIWHKIMEVYDMELTIHEETWPYIDEFFRRVPEAMRNVPTFQEALAKSEQRGKQEGILLAQQQTLLRILHHKFGAVPFHVVQRIENSQDSKQLEKWLDQALDAQSLVELNFTSEQGI